MRCIVMTGVPGAGKTHERTVKNGRLIGLPFVDIADVYDVVEDVSWDAAVMAMLVKVERLFQQGADTVVLEGIFLEGMPSRELLECELESMRIDAQFILVHQSYWACDEGITRSSEGYEARRRHELLDLYWDKAEALFRRDEHGDDD